MVSETSKKARQRNKANQFTQLEKVFNCLFFDGFFNGLTAPEISEKMHIRLTTVHARLCDLKKEPTIVGGEAWYIHVIGKKNGFQVYALKRTPQYTPDERAAILRDIRRGFRRLKRYDLARLREIKTLFDQ